MGEMIHITLKLGVRQFQLDVRRSDEWHYREAEKLINQRFRFYADRHPGQTSETYLLMTLLEVAVALKQSENQGGEELLNALQSMCNSIDEALS